MKKHGFFALIVVLICCSLLAACGGNEQKPYEPGEKFTVSGSDSDSSDGISAGGFINVVEAATNATNELVYTSRMGKPFTYDGTPVEAVLAVGSSSTFAADAVVFVMVDNIIQSASFDGGAPTRFHHISFPAVKSTESGDARYIGISFTPVAASSVTEHTVCFYYYLYDTVYNDEAFDSSNIPPAELQCSLSFGGIDYSLIISGDAAPAYGEGDLSTAVEYAECRHASSTDSFVELTTSDDPDDYEGYNIRLSTSDKLYLQLYEAHQSRYMSLLLIDNELYPAFGGRSQLAWEMTGSTIARTVLSLDGLDKGTHIADVLTIDLQSGSRAM